jgi:hypothetical protein
VVMAIHWQGATAQGAKGKHRSAGFWPYPWQSF